MPHLATPSHHSLLALVLSFLLGLLEKLGDLQEISELIYGTCVLHCHTKEMRQENSSILKFQFFHLNSTFSKIDSVIINTEAKNEIYNLSVFLTAISQRLAVIFRLSLTE